MLKQLLEKIIKPGLSDLHLKANEPPMARILGRLSPVNAAPMQASDIEKIVASVISEQQKEDLKKHGDITMSLPVEGFGRVRINIYKQQGTLAVAIRIIPGECKSFDDLYLPKETLEKLSHAQRGLILISGVTGAGKTTTLNALINYMNENNAFNIITIEDPIEYTHVRKKSSVSQREVGRDVDSFSSALTNILRQDPDVIVIGEMISPETFRGAIEGAASGHLVLATVHSSDAFDAVERIVNSFEFQEQPYVRLQLTNVLTAVISQRLIPDKNGRNCFPATEIMLGSSQMRKLLMTNSPGEVKFLIEKSGAYGMHTFDQDLFRMFEQGLISPNDALAYATNPNDLRLKMQSTPGNPGLESVK